MRIVLLSRFFMSGQTTHVVELALSLARIGHRPSIVTFGPAVHAWNMYRERLIDSGITAVRAPARGKIADSVRSLRPDVLHVHSSDLIAPARHIGVALGIPVIVTAHGLGVAQKAPSIFNVHRVIAVGPRVCADLRQAGVDRPVIIPNSVDIDRYRPTYRPRSIKSPWRIAYIGRVDETKRAGLSQLIRAVERIPRVQLTLASNVRWPHARVLNVGWLVDTAPLIGASDIVIGTGRTIRESMAAGAVAVLLGTQYGGVVSPETIDIDAEAGPVFSGLTGRPPDQHEIRRDLIRVVQDPCRRIALSRWGRAMAVKHFSLSATVEAVVSLYQETVQLPVVRQ